MPVTMASDMNDGICVWTNTSLEFCTFEVFSSLLRICAMFPTLMSESGTTGSQTHDLWVASPTPQPLHHRATARCEKIFYSMSCYSIVKRWEIKMLLHLSSRYSIVCGWHRGSVPGVHKRWSKPCYLIVANGVALCECTNAAYMYSVCTLCPIRNVHLLFYE